MAVNLARSPSDLSDTVDLFVALLPPLVLLLGIILGARSF